MSSRFAVLVVDDEAEVADLTATYVEREDERICTTIATDVATGLELLEEQAFDCIVSDFDMPGQNGLEFLEAVRDRFGDIPFAFYTGKGSEEVASKAFSAGANQYYQKESGTDQYTLLANSICNLAEKYRAENEKARNLQVMETANEGLSIIADDGTFEYVNQAYADMFGYEQSEMVGRSWSFIYPEKDVAHVRDEVIPAVPEDGSWSDETIFLRSDGSTFIADHSLARADGDRFICTVRDISEELKHREEHQAQRTLLDLFIESIESYAIFTLDPEGDVATWNAGAKRITGYEASDVLGEHYSMFFPPHEANTDVPDTLLEQAAAEGASTDDGWRVRKDGSRFWEGMTISAIRDEDDELVGFGTVVYDATKDREEQERQRAANEKIRRLHETTRALVSAETKAEVADIAVETLEGTLDLPLGGCWLHDESTASLVPVASTAQSEEQIVDLPSFGQGEGLAWEVFESGEARAFDDVSSHPGRYNPETKFRSELILPMGDQGVLIVGSTATKEFTETDLNVAKVLAENTAMALERLDREEALNDERAFVDSTLDHIPDMFVVFAPDGTPIRWNSKLTDVTGYTDAEVAEMNILDLFAGGDTQRVAEALERVLETGNVEVETAFVTKDGERIPYTFKAAQITDTDGESSGIVGIGRDITDQQEHEAELERRNERLEELASVLSHDLRNPLNVAQGYVEMVRETGDIDRLEYVERALMRMNTFIEDLLVLAREGRVISSTTNIDLEAAADNAWEHVQSRDVPLTVTTERTLVADRTRLLQVLENLMRNAIEHGGPDVAVRIGDLPDGFYVEDTGRGFPTTVLEQFENGEIVEGHLGLRIVRTISDAHGWEMRLTASDEGGSRIEFKTDDANAS